MFFYVSKGTFCLLGNIAISGAHARPGESALRAEAKCVTSHVISPSLAFLHAAIQDATSSKKAGRLMGGTSDFQADNVLFHKNNNTKVFYFFMYQKEHFVCLGI